MRRPQRPTSNRPWLTRALRVLSLAALAALVLVTYLWLRPGVRHQVQSAGQGRQPLVPRREAKTLAPPGVPSPDATPRSVTGIVIDEGGTALAEVAVNLTGHGEVKSQADGHFEIPDVAPGSYYLNAHSDRAAAGPLPLHIEDAPQFVTVRLHPGVSLTVEVVSVVDGRPLPRARGSLGLQNMLGAAGSIRAVADEHGVLHFPVAALGNYHVTAEADGYAPSTRLLTWLDRTGLAWKATIALERGVVLAGRVVDEGGAAVAGAHVSSRAPQRAKTQVPYRPRPPDPLRPVVETDADGRFSYPVPVGQGLVLVARHERYVSADSGTIVAARAMDVTMTLHTGRELTGRVVDRDHNPVANATVTDGPPDATPPPHLTRTDADGRFRLPGLDPTRAQAVLFASTPDRRSSPLLLTLPDGFGHPVELVVDNQLRLAGSVLDASGAPVPDAIVHFQRKLPEDYSLPPANPSAVLEAAINGESRSDGDGAFAIPGLAAGEYQLLVRAPAAGSDRVSPPLMTTLVAVAGDEHLTVTMPATARIRGRAVASDGQPVSALQVSLVQFGGATHVTSADGRFELTQIDPTPGRYQVEVAATGSAPTKVEARVTAGQTTDLGTIVLKRGRTLRGRVLDAAGGGPVANALVSVDGPDGSPIASGRSDELGKFEIPATADPLLVHASVTGVGGSHFELVPAERDSVELRVPETGRLDVAVTGEAATDDLVVTATRTDTPDSGFRIWVLDRASDAEFHGEVSPGEYVVHAARGRSLAGMQRGSTRGDVAVAVTAGQAQRVSVTLGGRSASLTP